jgi:lysophospholipase L1-like esterase
VPATGGQGAGGTTGAGGAAAGGATTSTGGKATGGAVGSGGNTAGAPGSGGSATGGNATGGTSGTSGTTGTYHPCPTDGTACKIMPFGDSITDGYNLDTPGGYRVELFRLAHSAGKNITFVGSSSNGPATVDSVAFPPHHEGHSGWTIYPLGGRQGISTCLQANAGCTNNSVLSLYTPDIVLLMIGTNDCIDTKDITQMPAVATRLGTLIDAIYAQLPNVMIVVAQPIPSRGDADKGDDAALPDRLKAYGDAIPALVKARDDAGKHILLIDMYAPFNPNKASLIEDEWHPNLAGYVVLATQWYNVLKSLL